MSNSNSTLTQERLKELLHYDPETGIFRWAKTRCSTARAGQETACCNSHGYRVIRLDYRLYGAHRLAWLYVHGAQPEHIDHINGVRSDNRISNLRAATKAQNQQNFRRANRNNANRLLGVYDSYGKWRSAIMVNGVSRHLGTFASPELAHAAYIEAKRKYHPFCTL